METNDSSFRDTPTPVKSLISSHAIFEISKKKFFFQKIIFFSSGGSLSITQLHFKDPIAIFDIFEHQFLTFKAIVGDKYQTKIASCLEKKTFKI